LIISVTEEFFFIKIIKLNKDGTILSSKNSYILDMRVDIGCSRGNIRTEYEWGGGTGSVGSK
jgi:hypothetical protein